MSYHIKPELELLLHNFSHQVKVLRIGAFQKGNHICVSILVLATDNFPCESWYLKELKSIRFKPASKSKAAQLRLWKQTINKLLQILEAMIEEIRRKFRDQQFNIQHIRKTRFIVWACFVSFSLLLWLFNEVVRWQWLSGHPRKIAIYCCCEFALIVSALLLSRPKKGTDIFILFVTIALALCALL
jgi:hypothetical protein